MIGTNTCVRTENVLKVRKMRISRVWWKNVKKKTLHDVFLRQEEHSLSFKKKKKTTWFWATIRLRQQPKLLELTPVSDLQACGLRAVFRQKEQNPLDSQIKTPSAREPRQEPEMGWRQQRTRPGPIHNWPSGLHHPHPSTSLPGAPL